MEPRGLRHPPRHPSHSEFGGAAWAWFGAAVRGPLFWVRHQGQLLPADLWARKMV